MTTTRVPAPGPFLRAVAVVDLSRARPWSAARRAAVAVIVIAVTWHWLGPSTAASTGIAALFIGIMDRQKSPRATVRTMAVGTVAMALTHLVADSLVPWPATVIAILVVVAFAEGAAITFHPDAPQVLHYCGTIAATALVVEPTPGGAWVSALAVLAAGAAQTLATYASARFTPRIREDVQVAGELSLLARSLEAVARGDDPLRPDAETVALLDAASRAMTATQRAVSRSDLAPYRVELLALVLWAAEQVRLEVKSLAVAGRLGAAPADVDPAVLRTRLAGTARTLGLGAEALRRHGRAQRVAVDTLLATPDSMWPASPHLRPVLADFVAGVAQLAREEPVRHTPSGLAREERRRRLATALTPGTLPFRLGARLGLAAFVAMATATSLGLVHASWASNSVLSIFRPDAGATLSRSVLRAIGATAAAALLVGVVLVVPDPRPVVAVGLGVVATLAYTFTASNYAVFGFFFSLSILSVLVLTGADPVEMATARWLDTLLGCTVAVVVAFLLPVWRIRDLPAGLGATCGALADWLDAIGAGLAAEPGTRDLAGVRAAGERTRDRISDTVATFRVARLEPPGTIPVARLQVVFTLVRDVAQVALAAEDGLRRGGPADPGAAATARHAAATLRAAEAGVCGGVPGDGVTGREAARGVPVADGADAAGVAGHGLTPAAVVLGTAADLADQAWRAASG